MKFCKLTVLLFWIFLIGQIHAWAHEYTSGHLVIEHPHMTPPVPGANVSAGYVTVINTGSESERLIGVAARFADKAQIHSTRVVDGIARMRPIKGGIVIPPGKSIVLKSGGDHLMFMQVSPTIEVGQLLPVRMMFERAGHIEVEMIVVDPADIDDDEEAADHSGHSQ